MIWLSIVSITGGALLAHRFQVIVLLPATFLVLLLAIAAGLAQTKGVWSILLMMALASVCLQTGYFVGILLHYGSPLGHARRSSWFSHHSSARDSAL